MTAPSEYASWIGRCEEAEDTLSADTVRGLTAVLDHEPESPDDAPPLLAHWLCFLPRTPQSGLGPDGHPRRGGFLPSVRLPRRMWAGGDLWFSAPLRTGVPVRRTSEIVDVREREGRSGPLVFVTVDHKLRQDGALVLTERQDVVYREAPSGATAAAGGTRERPAEEPPPGAWQRSLVPDPVLLFRYSALTFNGHRIHYDRTYAQQEEGYPGLVVHGPLTATLLLDLYVRQQPAAHVTGFRFRGLRPGFDGRELTLHGTPTGTGASLYAADDQGRTVMSAEVDAS
ncbi:MULTISPECIES: MaoC family dehydratase N-terminal domain-containing protein [unclassified Streptomyces]|uniref:FAS1-like dehydratase domain-containing protein n=1 Tax=unclassified Streptomyces TaxID=2593676 RepID=UPI002DD81315|nr:MULTISPECIES: MaoC family dehydratase N-terminal domain-containing protein [unclassified Streptomyces]WSA90127.1 MaoC family dehydratase N-terminal domain-containing protein [Streptomyces sp. NBC_01795]WSB74358.1 MaoC family dehydratase N-terminal domain-containing protein [Streptomyces sp. NBC_01775]WSS17261.1 MaoC family dehydratase N-terminal domain-containing protein [Streptomyces sp. NBC_01186]WSS46003.1 MaoC family dehydratase N-terminal domain-containing protein [Streptomyces sp. NBC_